MLWYAFPNGPIFMCVNVIKNNCRSVTVCKHVCPCTKTMKMKVPVPTAQNSATNAHALLKSSSHVNACQIELPGWPFHFHISISGLWQSSGCSQIAAQELLWTPKHVFWPSFRSVLDKHESLHEIISPKKIQLLQLINSFKHFWVKFLVNV